MADKISDLLVVSDVDGTLLQAGYGIPKENIDAVERFVARGGRFTVCTGRSVVSIRRYIDWIALTAPAVLNNGAVIYDYSKEKVIYANTLGGNIIAVIKEIVETFPDVGAELHSVHGIEVVRQNEETHKHTSVEHIPFVLADIDAVKGPWTKALLAGKAERIKQVDRFVANKIKTDARYQDFDFVFSSDTFLEILAKGVNKGTGLKKLAELLKVDLEDTVAIGDYYNDIEMLEVAGHTAAVADAPADIRANVDVVVKSCLQGGVGELLDSLELLCGDYEQLRLDM